MRGTAVQLVSVGSVSTDHRRLPVNRSLSTEYSSRSLITSIQISTFAISCRGQAVNVYFGGDFTQIIPVGPPSRMERCTNGSGGNGYGRR